VTPTNTFVLDVQGELLQRREVDRHPLLPSLGLCSLGVSSSANCLGGNNGSGFGWENMTIVKLGWHLAMNPDWTLRAGVSHGDQPIPLSEVLFNILAPAVIETHLTARFTWNMAPNIEINFAGMYAPE
jgi:long-chain fatty acid transport protein